MKKKTRIRNEQIKTILERELCSDFQINNSGRKFNNLPPESNILPTLKELVGYPNTSVLENINFISSNHQINNYITLDSTSTIKPTTIRFALPSRNLDTAMTRGFYVTKEINNIVDTTRSTTTAATAANNVYQKSNKDRRNRNKVLDNPRRAIDLSSNRLRNDDESVASNSSEVSVAMRYCYWNADIASPEF